MRKYKRANLKHREAVESLSQRGNIRAEGPRGKRSVMIIWSHLLEDSETWILQPDVVEILFLSTMINFKNQNPSKVTTKIQ